MLDGITILNKTVVMDHPEWFGYVIFTMFIVFVVSGIFLFAALALDWNGIFVALGIVCVASAFGIMGLCIFTEEVETDRYRYEVTVGPYVLFTDIYERYDVVERRGDIWVLEDKSER